MYMIKIRTWYYFAMQPQILLLWADPRTWGLCKLWKVVKGAERGRGERSSKAWVRTQLFGGFHSSPWGSVKQKRQPVLAHDNKQEKKPKTPQALKRTAFRHWEVQTEGNINRNVWARLKLLLGPESNHLQPPWAPHLNQADVEGN